MKPKPSRGFFVALVTERDIAAAPSLFPLVDSVIAIRGDDGVEAFSLDDNELAAAVIAWARRERKNYTEGWHARQRERIRQEDELERQREDDHAQDYAQLCAERTRREAMAKPRRARLRVVTPATQ